MKELNPLKPVYISSGINFQISRAVMSVDDHTWPLEVSPFRYSTNQSNRLERALVLIPDVKWWEEQKKVRCY